jgi:hypothetical protein
MQISLKVQFTVQARAALLLPLFYKLISNIMYVSTTKHPLSCQNSLSLLSLLCQEKDQKTFSHFKSLNSSLMLCQQQHVTHVLQAEQGWSKK